MRVESGEWRGDRGWRVERRQEGTEGTEGTEGKIGKKEGKKEGKKPFIIKKQVARIIIKEMVQTVISGVS
jgi:hypothetical protein